MLTWPGNLAIATADVKQMNSVEASTSWFAENVDEAFVHVIPSKGD
jgi:hypothetical protein